MLRIRNGDCFFNVRYFLFYLFGLLSNLCRYGEGGSVQFCLLSFFYSMFFFLFFLEVVSWKNYLVRHLKGFVIFSRIIGCAEMLLFTSFSDSSWLF